MRYAAWMLTLMIGACPAQDAWPAEGELITFRNSPAITEVISLNNQRAILGRHEVAAEGVLSMEHYLRVDGQDRTVPIPRDFTHVEPQVITDSGHVVGFATRPAGSPTGSQRTFVWAIGENHPDLLPVPETFYDSCAFDSSQDARRVAGYALGRDPPRMIPCVWSRTATGWTCQLLPVMDPFNPLLTSAHVAISDNGQRVAASLVIGYTPRQTRLYGLFTWQPNAEGQWQSEKLFERGVRVGDINDDGLIAGRILEGYTYRAFIYDPAQGAQVLPLPPGRQSAYATDVNRHGQVVGVSEDPPGPEGTMSAFLWYRGQLKELPFGMDVAASTANTINDQGDVGGLLTRAGNAEDTASVESYILTIKTPVD